MWKIALFSLTLALIGCSPSDFLAAEDGGSTYTIAALKRLYLGSSELLTEDIFICGVVSANDRLGEISGAIIIDDGSAAIEIMCDKEQLYLDYPLYTEIKLRCSGLYLASNEIGSTPSEDYSLSGIEEEELASRITICGDGGSLAPIVTSIDALDDTMIKRTVQISGVRFLPHESATSLCERDSDTGRTIWTVHKIEDERGDQISLHFSSDIRYPDEPIPSGYGTIVAYLDRYGSSYQLRIINHGLYF